MSFNFPNSPALNQLFPVTPAAGQPQYTWDGEKWKGVGSYNFSAIYMQDSPPVAQPGSLWWETDTANLYAYYNDGNSSQWVMIVPQADVGGMGAVLYNVAQVLTGAQKAQATTNIGAIAKINVQKFTASGTYTPSANLLYAIIECVGGGGGGGGISSGAAGTSYGAGGGGSGGYSRTCASAATIGASKPVTIGALGAGAPAGASNGTAGGNTSVGTLCVANGGGGGTFSSGGVVGFGGAGAAAGTGDIAAAGQNGGIPVYLQSANLSVPSGCGGSSIFGGGAPSVGNANGAAATGYGGGGSGGAQQNAIISKSGGDGAPGVVIITEYCAA